MGRHSDRLDDARTSRPHPSHPPLPDQSSPPLEPFDLPLERFDVALERFELSPGTVSRHREPVGYVGQLAGHGAPPLTRVAPPIGERIAWVLTGAGFPQLLIERGSVVLSGFVLVPESDACARIRWVGSAEVNALPYRRTFLGVYAQTLREAGLHARYVDDRVEPYLVCRTSPDEVEPPG